MTDEQCNKFLTLLMGQCWHEWKAKYLTNGHTVNSNPTLVCKYCDIARVGDDNPDHLANPLPVNDEVEHVESRDCWCKPRIEESEQVVVHNSFDGREDFEELEEI